MREGLSPGIPDIPMRVSAKFRLAAGYIMRIDVCKLSDMLFYEYVYIRGARVSVARDRDRCIGSHPTSRARCRVSSVNGFLQIVLFASTLKIA